MAERLIVVDKDRLDYDGLFDVKEVHRVFQDWASDKGYWLVEKIHSETTRPEGKIIDLVLEPFRKVSDYVKYIIKIRVQFSNVRDVVVERDNKKVKVQEGKVSVVMTGIVETDYEHRWETKPVWYTIRVFMDKYVLSPFISRSESEVKDDVTSLKNNLKGFLNLSKFW
jgi:hypothetical protein